MCVDFQGRHEQTKNTQQMMGEMKFDLAYWCNLSADEDASEVLLSILLYVQCWNYYKVIIRQKISDHKLLHFI